MYCLKTLSQTHAHTRTRAHTHMKRCKIQLNMSSLMQKCNVNNESDKNDFTNYSADENSSMDNTSLHTCDTDAIMSCICEQLLYGFICLSFMLGSVSFAIYFILVGSSNVLRGVLIPELFGANMMADLLGISMFFSSIAAFTGLPKAGQQLK